MLPTPDGGHFETLSLNIISINLQKIVHNENCVKLTKLTVGYLLVWALAVNNVHIQIVFDQIGSKIKLIKQQ